MFLWPSSSRLTRRELLLCAALHGSNIWVQSWMTGLDRKLTYLFKDLDFLLRLDLLWIESFKELHTLPQSTAGWQRWGWHPHTHLWTMSLHHIVWLSVHKIAHTHTHSRFSTLVDFTSCSGTGGRPPCPRLLTFIWQHSGILMWVSTEHLFHAQRVGAGLLFQCCRMEG